MHDALADRSRVVYDPYTPEQQQGIRRQLERFTAAQVKRGGTSLLSLLMKYTKRCRYVIRDSKRS